jgi:two-component system chemotaxis sensor kinase CheA
VESDISNDFDDEFMASILGEFLDESQGYLADLNDNLLALDELVSTLDEAETAQVDLETLNTMFRAAHSMKGLSAMLQLDDISRLTHNIENVFDAARNDTLPIRRGVVDLMFQAFDRLTSMVNQLSEPGSEDPQYEGIIRDIQNMLASSTGKSSDEASVSAPVKTVVNTVTADDASKPDPEVETQPAEHAETSAAAEAPSMQISDPFSDVVDEIDPSDKYLAIFLDDSENSLENLAEVMLSEDQDSLVDRALVICHQIKGAAATVRLNRVAKLSHMMEDLLQQLREGGHPITSDVADAVVFAVDSVRTYLQSIQSNAPGPDTIVEAYRRLEDAHASALSIDAAVQAPADDTNAVAGRESLTDSDRALLAAAAPANQTALIGLVVFEERLPLVELKAKLVVKRLASLGNVFHCDPDEQQIDDCPNLTSLLFGLASDCDPLFVRRQIDLDGVINVELEPLTLKSTDTPVADPSSGAAQPAAVDSKSESPQPAAQPPGNTVGTAAEVQKAPDESRPQNKPVETIRVDIDRLDQLMNLAGQLVINKARFGQLSSKLKGLANQRQASVSLANIDNVLGRMLSDADDLHEPIGSDDVYVRSVHCYAEQIRADLEVVRSDITQFFEARSLLNDLSDAVHQLDRVSDGMQKSVMNTRMVPIGPLFGRFKRVIRDITRVNGKEVQLMIRGEKTELDKRMIDELGDPLIHMVRNAADHGIESPDERKAAGKPRQGTVTLDAYHRGNRILIQVRDDGKGLVPEKIRDTAVSKGIISAADAERLTPQQTYQLIWEPGFSTADQVTEVSGRGMGMDIVRSKIEQINGSVELDSELGVGTTITIKLPLTMAILPSLLTVVSGNVYAVPVESVVEIVRIKRSELATVHGCRTARVRGRVISVVELQELLQWAEGAHPGEEASEDITLVIIGTDGSEMALPVDDLLGEEDIVIKSLADNYQNVSGIAGASILGDGRVSLILDVSALLDMACRRRPAIDSDVAQHGLALSAN